MPTECAESGCPNKTDSGICTECAAEQKYGTTSRAYNADGSRVDETRDDEELDEDREIRTDGGTRTQPDRLAGWEPTASDSTAPRCQNCNVRVLKGTVRVFGSNDGVLYHCGSCLSLRDLYYGAGFKPDYDPETDRGKSSENHPIFPGGDGQ